jgi:hypothetical protein
MAGLKTALVVALGTTAFVLGACDNGPSAVQSKQAAGTQMASAGTPARAASDGAPRVDHREDPVKLGVG